MVENLAGRRVERRKHGGQRRRLAASRWARHGDHAMGQIEQAQKLLFVRVAQAEL